MGDIKTSTCRVCLMKTRYPVNKLRFKAIYFEITIPKEMYEDALRETRACYCGTDKWDFDITVKSHNALYGIVQEGVSKVITDAVSANAIAEAKAIVEKLLEEAKINCKNANERNCLDPHTKYIMGILMGGERKSTVTGIKIGHLARMNRLLDKELNN